ncbi:hypothetical protein BGZ73_003778 [Actinomortierella ambigua]|nr:hypothetical protein BGZ73_003778 [Actinomortierella ambigua]
MSSGSQQAEHSQQQPQQRQKPVDEPQGLISISLKENSVKPDAGPPQQEPVNGGGASGEHGESHHTGAESNVTGEWQQGSANDTNGGVDPGYQLHYGYSSYHGGGEARRASASGYDLPAPHDEEEGALPSSNEYDPGYYEQPHRTWSEHGEKSMTEPPRVEGTDGHGATHDQLEYGTLFEPFQRAEEQRGEGAIEGQSNTDNYREGDDATTLERRVYDSWRPSGKAKASQNGPKKVSAEKQELIEKRLSMERPCRSLFIRNIGYSTGDDVIRELYSSYGDIQNFHTLLDRRGMAFISYFDLRDAENAKATTHGQLVDGRAT